MSPNLGMVVHLWKHSLGEARARELQVQSLLKLHRETISLNKKNNKKERILSYFLPWLIKYGLYI
jgi:hypothetical protein